MREYPHGTRERYRSRHTRCRCDACRAANTRVDKQIVYDNGHGRPHSIPAWRVRRRIEALACMGWSISEIARRIGLPYPEPLARAVRRQQRVYAPLYEKVAAVYEELCMIDAEEHEGHDGSVRQVKMRAKRKGYAPPLAWDDIDDPNEKPNLGGRDREVDEVVVQRILDGDYSLADKATKAERIEVVARWRADRRSLKQLEVETGWRPDRYVTRTPADVRRIIERSLAS